VEGKMSQCGSYTLRTHHHSIALNPGTDRGNICGRNSTVYVHYILWRSTTRHFTHNVRICA